MKRQRMAVVGLLLAAQPACAQTFKLLRYDEDYSALQDSARSFYNRLKYTPLTASGRSYISLGGEVRQEVDRAQNEDWGARNIGTDVFSLQRYNLHADLHFGGRCRVFGQLRSGLEFGRKTGPRPIDEDRLNVQNLFLDVVPYQRHDQSLTLRLGRQEIQYGSGRLLDVREGPNLRLYFDGAKVAYASRKWAVDGFLLANARVKTGVFDNPTNRKANLWGVYSTRTAAPDKGLDLYYLGIAREKATFDEGTADERRHTLGVRCWRGGSGLLYNLEIGYQWGTFGAGSIRSWGGSAEVGYRFPDLKSALTAKLRADFVSGDKTKGDGKLGTFNALYPNGGYFGMNPQAGPANICSLHPSLAWSPVRRVLLAFDGVFYWRQSLQDGIYRPDGTFNRSAAGSRQRYIGTSYITTATWEMNRFLSFTVGAQYFETGNFINDIIPQHRNGFFVSSLLIFKY